jgi:hypothetical protein
MMPAAAPNTWHRPLLIMIGGMAGLAVVTGFGLAVDERQVLGESVWLKPLKFAVSFVIYGMTLAWLLSRLDPRRTTARRIGWWAATAFAITGVIDVGFVAVQAARGTFSHFNNDPEPFNQIGQQVFQFGVIGLFLANLVLAIVLLIQRVGSPAIRWAIGVGLVLAVAGMMVPFALAGSGDAHQVTDAYGRAAELGSSHSIGVAPGGPGLPFLGWSLTGGDLRAPHFFGMHTIQLLMALVLVLGRLSTRYGWLRPEQVRGRLLAVAGLLATGLFVLLSVQATRGESVIMVRPWSALLAGSLVIIGTLAVGMIIAGARRTIEPTPEVDRSVVAR